MTVVELRKALEQFAPNKKITNGFGDKVLQLTSDERGVYIWFKGDRNGKV